MVKTRTWYMAGVASTYTEESTAQYSRWYADRNLGGGSQQISTQVPANLTSSFTTVQPGAFTSLTQNFVKNTFRLGKKAPIFEYQNDRRFPHFAAPIIQPRPPCTARMPKAAFAGPSCSRQRPARLSVPGRNLRMGHQQRG